MIFGRNSRAIFRVLANLPELGEYEHESGKYTGIIMGEGAQGVLKSLIEVSKIDAKIANVIAERERLNNQLTEKLTELKQKKADADAKRLVFEENEARLRKEERYVRDEQSKLVDRRKALTTLSTYKLQMAAEKEIETASKQLSAQEEAIIGLMDSVDELKSQSQEAASIFESLRSEVETFEAEVKDTLVALEERMAEAEKDRAEITDTIEKKFLSTYERIKERYPQDAVVALSGTSCSGCFLELGPQTAVNISRGEELIRCRGCGRILYIAEE